MFEAAFLENDTDALAETSSTGLRVEPENRYGPRCGAPVALEDFDQRCLASAVGTEKGKDFALAHGEASAIDCRRGAVSLNEILDDDDRRRAPGRRSFGSVGSEHHVGADR